MLSKGGAGTEERQRSPAGVWDPRGIPQGVGGGLRPPQRQGLPSVLPGGGARLGHAERGTFPAGGEAERSPCHRQLRGPARGPAQRYEVRAAAGAGGGARGAECRTGGWCRCRCRCHAAAGGLLSSAPSPRGLQRSVPNLAIASRCRRGGRDPGGVWGTRLAPPPGQQATPGPPQRGGAVPLIPPAWRCHRVARGSRGVHVRQWLRLCGRARVSAEAPPNRQRRAPPGPPAPAASGPPGHAGRPGTGRGAPADLRADQAAAGGDQHGLVLQPGRRHGRRVPARIPLDLPELRRGVRVSRAGRVGGGGLRPVPPAPVRGALHAPLCLAGTWRSAWWRSWPPLGPPCPAVAPPPPPARHRTSPTGPPQATRPGPGLPQPAVPPRGQGAAPPGAGTHQPPPATRCQGASWAPPATRPTCGGCRRPMCAGGGRPPTSHPPPTTHPTAPFSPGHAAAPGGRAAPRRHRGAVGLCWGAGATRCPGQPPRLGPGGPAGCRPPLEEWDPPGTARRCPVRQLAGRGSRGAAEDGGGRGDTSSSMPPAWWSGPSTCPPRSGSRSGTPGGALGPPPPRAVPLLPPRPAPLPQHPRPPASCRAAPGAPSRARGQAGGPGGAPPRGGRRCTPRRCGRPCPASGGTRRPTPTRRPRGGPGGAGGGRAATPSPTAAAAAAWRAPGPPREPPAPPGPEGRGLKGRGSRGAELGRVWSWWGRGLAGCGPSGGGAWARFWRAGGGADPNKGCGIPLLCLCPLRAWGWGGLGPKVGGSSPKNGPKLGGGDTPGPKRALHRCPPHPSLYTRLCASFPSEDLGSPPWPPSTGGPPAASRSVTAPPPAPSSLGPP